MSRLQKINYKKFSGTFLVVLLLITTSFYAYSKPLKVTQNLSGPSGLVEMPTARMLPTGEFAVHFTKSSPYTRGAIIGQPLSWLQVLFKYTDIENVRYGSVALSGKQSYKDKSVDFKISLFKEGYYLPEISVGVNDLGGTGLFSSEYIVASKQFNNFDLTLGMGWGYLGSQAHLNNPFSLLSDKFNTRLSSNRGSGGKVEPSVFFTGKKVSLFGGVEYHMESYPAILKFEYDANNYQNEPHRKRFTQNSPFNLSAVYSINDSTDIHLGFVRGTTVVLGVSFRINLDSSGPPKYLDPAPVNIKENPVLSLPDWSSFSVKVSEKAGYQIKTVFEKDNALHLTGVQSSYRSFGKGIGRVSRLLVNNTPNKFNRFVFNDTFHGNVISSIAIDRKTFESAAKLQSKEDAILKSSTFTESVDIKSARLLYETDKKRFSYSVTPDFSGNFGGPDEFLLYQINLVGNANYLLRKNTWLSTVIELGLIDNYDKFKYTAPSNLPRVRTNIRQYLKESKLRLGRLQLSNFEQISNNVFFVAYAGYLESMYGGVGAEILYRPYNKSWAVGLDLNRVKQREFNMRFGFRDYEATTGHLTAYYETDDEILLKISAGQYLAKDKGATVNISRKFSNGAKMGFWFTKTNVSAKDFGEGSFDKGFTFSIPLDLFSVKSTAKTANFQWRFLTRDGGQKLYKQSDLYQMTNSRELKYIKESFEQVLQ